jgi:hypothetical protein
MLLSCNTLITALFSTPFVELPEQGIEIFWKRAFDFYPYFADGVDESKAPGMQGESLHQWLFFFEFAQVEVAELDFGKHKAVPLAIQGIHRQRMPDTAEMDPDLVGTACFDIGFHQAKIAVSI